MNQNGITSMINSTPNCTQTKRLPQFARKAPRDIEVRMAASNRITPMFTVTGREGFGAAVFIMVCGLTSHISRPAPMACSMEQGHHRRVRLHVLVSWFETHHRRGSVRR